MSTLPDIDLSEYEEVIEETTPAVVEPPTAPEESEESEGEEEEPTPQEPKEVKPQKELFDIPEDPDAKPKKKKRVLRPEQLEHLKIAREKSAIKRKALAAAKAKDKAIEVAKRKRHITERKKKEIENQALLEPHAEAYVMKEEQDMWSEDKLIGLMNRTLDTYFHKRNEEKTKRQQIPIDPAHYANYQPAMPPQRAIPKPQQPRKQLRNPYSAQFGLTPEDEDKWGV